MLFSDKVSQYWYVVILLFGIISILPMNANADTLKVVVQDQDNDAIPSAKVVIGGEEQTTDDNGTVIFSDVTGAQTVQISAIGYAARRVNTSAGQSELTVMLAPIQTVDTVVVVGTRSIGRRALQAPVPIDVVEREQLSLTGQS